MAKWIFMFFFLYFVFSNFVNLVRKLLQLMLNCVYGVNTFGTNTFNWIE